MTDNEIIKALECCGDKNCKYCPNFSEDIECSEKLIKLSLDLIKRQKAEIEKLQVSTMVCEQRDLIIENAKLITLNWGNPIIVAIKSEAIREFAERLKEKSVWDDKGDTKIVYEYDIDKIAKEMTEQ